MDTAPFGRSGHNSALVLFGAAALGVAHPRQLCVELRSSDSGSPLTSP